MPNTCENCDHWKRLEASRAAAAGIAVNNGECHSEPPTESYRWPRTMATDYCSCHSAAMARYAQAQLPPPKPEKARGRKGEELPLR